MVAASYTAVGVSGVTFDGDAMTLAFSGAEAFSGGPTITYSVYKLLNPEAKTGDIVATWAAPSSDMLFYAFACDGVDQADPIPSNIDDRHFDDCERHPGIRPPTTSSASRP